MSQETLKLSPEFTTPKNYNGILTLRSCDEILIDLDTFKETDFEESLGQPVQNNHKVLSEIKNHLPDHDNNCLECEWKFSQKIAILEKKLADECDIRNQQMKIITEHEKNTQERLGEKNKELENLKKDKKIIEFKCSDLKNELEITSQHLANLEVSFNDVHKKYEKAKQTIYNLQKNVEILKNNMSEHENCINLKHQQFVQLKEHAIERLTFANAQLDLMHRKFSLECSKLRAIVNESQLQAKSLSEQLERTNQEKRELMSICDGLIKKIDFPENNSLKNLMADHNEELMRLRENE